MYEEVSYLEVLWWMALWGDTYCVESKRVCLERIRHDFFLLHVWGDKYKGQR
jgi:hypothetical protein